MTATPPGLYDIAGRFDPEATNWINRGIRVYDFNRPLSEAEALLTHEALAVQRVKRPGGAVYVNGSRCVCGECLWALKCGSAL